MSMLQVRNLPAQLHEALAERARTQNLSMSEYVIRLLRRDLSRPTVEEWVAAQRADRSPRRRIDVVRTLDEVRVGYDLDERSRLDAPGPVSPLP